MFKPKIITFEGIDGSGKTTHIKKIENYLKAKKINYLSFREPGGTKNSEKIRRLILNKKNKFDSITDLLLIMASRNENIKMLKNYNKTKIILIDRFIHSSVAYQHYGMGINKKIIDMLNSYIINENKVHCTFLMLVNQSNLKKRFNIRIKLNRYDNFKLSFYKKVQNGYLKLSKKKINKFVIIDSNDDIKKNERIIKKKIDKILQQS